MVALVARMLVSLAVVLALMYVAARLLNRSRGGLRPGPRQRRPIGGKLAAVVGNPSAGELAVVGHRPLGKAASVALVRVADKAWLVGVTETSVRLLSELESQVDAMPDGAGLAAGTQRLSMTPAPVSLLDQLRERTVRRA